MRKTIMDQPFIYNGPTIYFTRYVQKKLIKMLNLHYHKLKGHIREHQEKIFHDWRLYARKRIRQN